LIDSFYFFFPRRIITSLTAPACALVGVITTTHEESERKGHFSLCNSGSSAAGKRESFSSPSEGKVYSGDQQDWKEERGQAARRQIAAALFEVEHLLSPVWFTHSISIRCWPIREKKESQDQHKGEASIPSFLSSGTILCSPCYLQDTKFQRADGLLDLVVCLAYQMLLSASLRL
jgi:hypothetical protein